MSPIKLSTAVQDEEGRFYFNGGAKFAVDPREIAAVEPLNVERTSRRAAQTLSAVILKSGQRCLSMDMPDGVIRAWEMAMADPEPAEAYKLAVSVPRWRSRWWLRTRPIPQRDGAPVAEIYVPWWAKPLDRVWRLINGTPKLSGGTADGGKGVGL